MRHHHADYSSSFAFDADAVRRNIGLASIQESTDYFDELLLVDRTTAQFEVNANMIRDGRGLVQCLDILRVRVDNGDELLHVLEVSQRLNDSGGGERSNSDKKFRRASYLVNALGVMWRGDGTFDQRQVIGTTHHRA